MSAVHQGIVQDNKTQTTGKQVNDSILLHLLMWHFALAWHFLGMCSLGSSAERISFLGSLFVWPLPSLSFVWPLPPLTSVWPLLSFDFEWPLLLLNSVWCLAPIHMLLLCTLLSRKGVLPRWSYALWSRWWSQGWSSSFRLVWRNRSGWVCSVLLFLDFSEFFLKGRDCWKEQLIFWE